MNRMIGLLWIFATLFKRNFFRYLLTIFAVAACVVVYVIAGTMGDIVYRTGLQPARITFGGDIVVSTGIYTTFDGTRGSMNFGDGIQSPYFKPEPLVTDLARLLPQATLTSSQFILFRNSTSTLALLARNDSSSDQSLRPRIDDDVWDAWKQEGGALFWDDERLKPLLLGTFAPELLRAEEGQLFHGIIPEYAEVQNHLIVGPLPERAQIGLDDSPGRSVSVRIKHILSPDNSPTVLTHIPWVNGNDRALLGSASDWVQLIGVAMPVGSDLTAHTALINDYLAKEYPLLVAQPVESCMDFLFSEYQQLETATNRFRPFIWIVITVVIALTQIALINSRRGEFLVYLRLGLDASRLWAILFIEACVITLLAALCGLVAAMFVVNALLNTMYIDWTIVGPFILLALPAFAVVFALFQKDLGQQNL